MVLASLVKLPEAVMVIFPAAPGGVVVPVPSGLSSAVRPGAGTVDLGAVRKAHGPYVQHHVSPSAATGGEGLDGTIVQGQRIRRDRHLPRVLSSRLTRDVTPTGNIDRAGIDGHIPSRPCGALTGLDHGPIRQADRVGIPP